MATKSKQVAVRASSTAIATIDQELANEVAVLKKAIGAPSGNKIEVQPTGAFVLPDGTNLGTEIQVVVLDFVGRNFYYDARYDPNTVTPPACYAIDKDRQQASMAPEADSPHKQSDTCAACPKNQFGTGDNGKGKACKNRYWLACLLVDDDNVGSHNAPTAPIYLLDLPPSQRRSFEGFVTTVGRALNGPPVKAIVSVVGANVGTYASITFTDPVANPDYAVHSARRAECVDILRRTPDFAAAAAAQPTRSKAAPRRHVGAR